MFAGPNGSGKSTVIQQVKIFTSGDKKIDLGQYINADDIAVSISQNSFTFTPFKIAPLKEEILEFAISSGLLDTGHFTEKVLHECFIVKDNVIILKQPIWKEHLAQVIAAI